MTVKPNDNFTLGAEVATYADENYVRGRIDEVLEGGKMFKVIAKACIFLFTKILLF